MSPFSVDIDDLDVVREIGKGRLGTVCLVTRRSDGRELALKVASPKISLATIDRDAFMGAFQEIQRLQHANIVRLLGVGQIRRAYCFLMEYCNAGSIDRRMAEHGGRLPVAEATLLLRQCLAGLAYAHAQGVVHRDLKPQNIVIHRDAGQLVAKLADFGLSAVLESAGLLGMTATCQAKIDYQFMPAERLTHFKQSDPRSDLWSLTATFYYALTGRSPRDFAGRDPIAVVLHAQTTALRVANPLVPEPLAEVLDRALRRDIPERFQTALEMQRALDEACGHRAQLGPGGLGLR
jgi:serine/threonine protein kinase